MVRQCLESHSYRMESHVSGQEIQQHVFLILKKTFGLTIIIIIVIRTYIDTDYVRSTVLSTLNTTSHLLLLETS